MPEPITIALAGFNLACLILAGISSERARVHKANAAKKERFLIASRAETKCAEDKVEGLHQQLRTADRRFIEKAGVLAAVTAERDAALTKLARFDGASRPRGAGGRFGARA